MNGVTACSAASGVASLPAVRLGRGAPAPNPASRAGRPASTATRSPSSTASRTSCVTSTQVAGWASITSSSQPCSSARVKASRLPNGSSSRTRPRPKTSVLARATRCRIPPESSRGRVSRAAASPNSPRIARARSSSSTRSGRPALRRRGLRRSPPCPSVTCHLGGEHRIRQHRFPREQQIALEHVCRVPRRAPGQPSPAKSAAATAWPSTMRLTRLGGHESGQQVQQRALAAAALPHHHETLPRREGEFQAGEHGHVSLPAVISGVQPADRYGGGGRAREGHPAAPLRPGRRRAGAREPELPSRRRQIVVAHRAA